MPTPRHIASLASLAVASAAVGQCSPHWQSGGAFGAIDGSVRCCNSWTPPGGTALLVAGGHFVHAGPVAAHDIAAWDGHTWSALGSGTSASQDSVFALAEF